MITDLGVSHFLGILVTIALYAFLTNVLIWGLFQILSEFFEDENKKRPENIFHHHYHYKARP